MSNYPAVVGELAMQFGYDKHHDEIWDAMCAQLGTTDVVDMAVMLSICKQYNLNPLAKEIYAFKQGGKLQPIVSIDGWNAIAQRNPNYDGELVEYIENGQQLIAVRCTIFHKNRKHPTICTEYLAENMGSSAIWKQRPRRMLTHRARAQAIRTAFGISGIHHDVFSIEEASQSPIVQAELVPEKLKELPPIPEPEPSKEAELFPSEDKAPPIVERMKASGKKLFTTKELAGMLGTPVKDAQAQLKNLADHGFIAAQSIDGETAWRVA